MSKVNLKNIFAKKNESAAFILSLIDVLQTDIIVEDSKSQLVFGVPSATQIHSFPIQLDDELLGWVKGDEKSAHIASLLNLLVKKENDQKRLGSEVLLLYQEVNMVFNFSDKLAQAIGAASIAQITLDEALRLTRSNNGMVVLWDPQNKQLTFPAISGEELFNTKNISTNAELMLSIGLNGQTDILSELSPLKKAGIIQPDVQSLIYSALKVNHRIMGAVILISTESNHYTAADLKFLTTLALQSSSAIESSLLYEKNIKEAKEKEEAMRKIYEVAGKFVPFEFIHSLGHDVITDVKLGDQVEKVVTVIFADIRDYTTLSEQMSPEENFEFVCSYNELLGPVIRKHNGFINQFLGDAIMALFPGSASDALAAAIEMKESILQFNKKRTKENKYPIQIGIGMHTGPLIMGITGDKDRLDATTISDTVNTASRLESLTKYYKAGIILSDATLKQIDDSSNFHLRYLGLVQVKGKQSHFGIHECFSGNDDIYIDKKLQTLDLFHEGIHCYLDRSFAKAIDSFENISVMDPDDHTALFFLENASRYLHNGVPENWAGAVEMNYK
ncbi:MAG: GAF domain-containing protein [Chitinophagaceae bacterium]|jgi:class 3 adenylate cyclase|nr:GAF domain-containing protein [Chitinophagaceae bacterium]